MIERELLGAEELGEAERIALAYAPAALRSRFQGLLLLDAQLARIALASREPVLAQLKLAWWRDACADLAKARGHPVLRLLAADWTERSALLAGLIDAWEELAVQPTAFLTAAESVASARAAAFAAAAGLAADAACRPARCWTLVALAQNATDSGQRADMLSTAGTIEPVPLPRALRPLAVLEGLARRSLRHGGGALVGDRLSPLAAIRLGIFGR